jgi:acetyl esterase/lipase
LVTNGLPFLAGYLLVASSALALAQGDLDSVGGAVIGVAALVVFVGLMVIVRRSLRADSALHNPTPVHRPWRRILMAPLPAFRRDVVRVRNLSYGEDRYQDLDIYHRRDRPNGVPVVLHFHGGGFHSGNKNREARPLIAHLVSGGMVCASANYRLRPHVGYDEQLADALDAIEWVRAHSQEYGGDPDRIFLVGSSAGAYLSVDAVNAGANGIAGIVGRYGYYGRLVAERPQPPILVIHGENDLYVSASYAREFVEGMRASSNHPVEYVQLPGGHHDFDLYESIRSNAVNIAVARFIELVLATRRSGGRQERPEPLGR